MRTIRATVDLQLEDNLIDFDNQEDKEWLLFILKKTELILHSQEIGDTIGEIKIIDADLSGIDWLNG